MATPPKWGLDPEVLSTSFKWVGFILAEEDKKEETNTRKNKQEKKKKGNKKNEEKRKEMDRFQWLVTWTRNKELYIYFDSYMYLVLW